MTSTPHDALFESVFSDPEHAAGELRSILPAALLARLDLATLRLEPGSFIDETLGARHSDLLFSSALRSPSPRAAYVYLLFEHLSGEGTAADSALLPLRLLRYMVRIWDSHLTHHVGAASLPVIVPVVIHHGERGWRGSTHFSIALDLGDDERAAFAAVIPDFEFLLDDITLVSDEQLRARVMAVHAQLALWFLRSARDGDRLLRDLAAWADVLRALLASPNGVQAFATLLRYYALVADVAPEAMRVQLTAAIGPMAEEAFVTTAQMMEEAGLARGLARGREEGREEGRTAGCAQAVLRVLAKRGFNLTENQRARVTGCTDLAVLERWLDRAVTATSADEALAAQ